MRPATLARVLLSLTAALLIGLPALTATPAASAASAPAADTRVRLAPPPPCAPRCWTAISFNPRAKIWGWTSKEGVGGKRLAMQKAQARCKARTKQETSAPPSACQWPGKRKVFAYNSCVAVAWRVRGERVVEWAKGNARDSITAERRARRAVRGAGQVTAKFACTFRPPR